jgi:hypothetical protein
LFGNGLGWNAWRATPLLDLKATLFHPYGFAVLEQTARHDFVFQYGSLVLASTESTECSYLEYSAISLESIYNGASFGDETGHRFFAQYVHTCFRRSNGNTGVPMRGSGNGYQVQVLALEKFSEVLIDLGFSLAPGLRESLSPVEVDVAGSNEFNVQAFA